MYPYVGTTGADPDAAQSKGRALGWWSELLGWGRAGGRVRGDRGVERRARQRGTSEKVGGSSRTLLHWILFSVLVCKVWHRGPPVCASKMVCADWRRCIVGPHSFLGETPVATTTPIDCNGKHFGTADALGTNLGLGGPPTDLYYLCSC